MKKTELLAPAGSYEGLTAAINAGADAVYIGGQKFSARAYAENPDQDMLVAGIEYAHLRDRKVYLTLNTLLKNSELTELYDYLKEPYAAGLDAVIVQDLGVLSYVREQFPDMPVHASTQMGITGAGGFRFLEQQGVTRVVPARELSLEELRYIRKNSSLEIEAFIHGALCYSYSGQCLLSSIIGGRSGNRGRCAQPCRLPYSLPGSSNIHSGKCSQYPLSLKDLCTIDLLSELIDAGICSFKIEGRMKRPEYTAGVVEIYRKVLDGIPITGKDRTQLLNLYSRSGNCNGYFTRHNGKSMVTLKSPGYRTGEDELFNRIRQDYLKTRHPLDITGSCRLQKGAPSCLELTYQDISVPVFGETPQEAQKQPLDAGTVEKRLLKTGESDFSFSILTTDVDEGLFLPVQHLNQLRRNGLEALREHLLQKSRREVPKKKSLPEEQKKACKEQPVLRVLVTSINQALAAADIPEIADVYIDTVSFSLRKSLTPYQDALHALKKAGKRVFLALPHIFRQDAKKAFHNAYSDIFLPGLDGCLVRNWESFQFLREEMQTHPNQNLSIRSDSSLYCFNRLSMDFLKEQQFESITLPVELNQKELFGLAEDCTEWIVYSHLPLMISAQCIRNTLSACSRESEILTLKDRIRKDFPVRNYCDFCYNILYNGTPMILWDKKIPAGAYRLDFHLESVQEMNAVIRDALYGIRTRKAPDGEFTRGHFNRGVE